MSALARRHGGAAAAPSVQPRPVRSLETIAIENVVEGCLFEGFGALIATWQAASAADPLIRAAMGRIARDETRHAALALAVHAWARGRLSKSARARVEEARRAALADVVAISQGVAPSLRLALGLPTPSQSHDLAREMERLTA